MRAFFCLNKSLLSKNKFTQYRENLHYLQFIVLENHTKVNGFNGLENPVRSLSSKHHK